MFLEAECSIRGKVIATASEVGSIYKLDNAVPFPPQNSLAAVQDNESIKLWHKRLGHLNENGMRQLRNGMADGINFNDENIEPCIPCIQGKQHRLPFNKTGGTRATQKLGLVHSDLCGPMSVDSAGGGKYILLFIDDFTRKIFIYVIKSKTQVTAKFKEFKAKVENETDLKIKVLRSDNGTEYVNQGLDSYLRQCGIEHQRFHTHQNRTVWLREPIEPFAKWRRVRCSTQDYQETHGRRLALQCI